MVREFYLSNEKGQIFSLMDINNYCLLTEPNGLGYGYETEYENLGNSFITNIRKVVQGQIVGQVNFLKYDNFRAFVDFVEQSESLQFIYKVPSEKDYKTYYRKIEISEIPKSEIQPNGVISETVIFNCLSLWYSTSTAIYTISSDVNEIRWDFKWDSYFAGYSSRDLSIVNTGHTDASIEVSIDGEVANPSIQLYVDKELYQEVRVADTIGQYEKFLYSSKEGDFYINKQGINGIITSLLSLSKINFSNDLVIRIPKNKSCRLVLNADSNISKAQVKIFVYYKAV